MNKHPENSHYKHRMYTEGNRYEINISIELLPSIWTAHSFK